MRRPNIVSLAVGRRAPSCSAVVTISAILYLWSAFSVKAGTSVYLVPFLRYHGAYADTNPDPLSSLHSIITYHSRDDQAADCVYQERRCCPSVHGGRNPLPQSCVIRNVEEKRKNDICAS